MKFNDRLLNLKQNNSTDSFNNQSHWRRNKIISVIVITKYSFDSALNKYDVARNCKIFRAIYNNKIITV